MNFRISSKVKVNQKKKRKNGKKKEEKKDRKIWKRNIK